MEKSCKNKDYEKPKDAKFVCEKCKRKSSKPNEVCKPVKIKKNED